MVHQILCNAQSQVSTCDGQLKCLWTANAYYELPI
jgi:hypothetical protein